MKKSIVRLALVIALLAPCNNVLGQAAASPGMEEDIRKLMEVTGAGNLGVQMMNQMLEPMKQATPNVPTEFWTRFMTKVDPGEMIDMVVPIYAKYFTHDEIKQLLAFYRTPLGEKLIATLPAIMQESMAAGQKWGQLLGQQVRKELDAEGYQ